MNQTASITDPLAHRGFDSSNVAKQTDRLSNDAINLDVIYGRDLSDRNVACVTR